MISRVMRNLPVSPFSVFQLYILVLFCRNRYSYRLAEINAKGDIAIGVCESRVRGLVVESTK